MGKWRLRADHGFTYDGGGVVSIGTEPAPPAEDFRLAQNYPNPFNPLTTIEFQVPQSRLVKLVVYDIPGRKVKTLINEHKPARFPGNIFR